jgi:hypothetical protein
MAELIGDLERALAGLYPNRGIIAVALAIVALAILWTAWRRRWDLAARRHPRRTLVALAILVLVGGPTAWYLGSPLFIRSELAEASGGGTVIAAGEFQGADEFHFGSGRASIVDPGAGVFTLRFSDFSVRNGPDLFVYVSPDAAGYADGAIELGALKATDGAFEYALPSAVDPSEVRSVVVWCRAFSVQFAVAALEPAS